MTEPIFQQISAFADDELSADECEFLVRRLERDPEARGKALRYAVAGAALRGELLGPDPDVLRRRLSAALEGVYVPVRRSPPEPGWVRRLTRPAVGVGIAASVAGIAIFALSSGIGFNDGDGAPTVAVDRGLATGDSEQPPSYVVPEAPGTEGSMTLTNYLMQHGQYTPAIRRASIDSAVASDSNVWQVVTEAEPAE
ncbi:MAG TPA: sigma-E factor negative regulatory protein [Gammaproteobacteria bacterium]|jgi:negative regulator of sigma E activity